MVGTKNPEDGKSKAIHYTEGGPWFKNYRNCEYGDVWKNYPARNDEKMICTTIGTKTKSLKSWVQGIGAEYPSWEEIKNTQR